MSCARMTRFPILLLVVILGLAVPTVEAQTCQVSVGMFNHNRFAYDTDEECTSFPHSVPFGNWGVSSNVGGVHNTDQFQGWSGTCGAGNKVEWNSCAVEYVRPDPDCRRLNFPHPSLSFPAPPGYPSADVYKHNECASGAIPCRCVDQVSPCGANHYGGRGWNFGVAAPYDSDCDGIFDAGGCRDLDGLIVSVTGNFMTVYELDWPDSDDLISTLYYPDVSIRLQCDVYSCWPEGDGNRDGVIDDLHDRTSSAWIWPTAYYDDWGQQRKRIDATIRIGSARGWYSGPDFSCNYACDPWCQEPCVNGQYGTNCPVY